MGLLSWCPPAVSTLRLRNLVRGSPCLLQPPSKETELSCYMRMDPWELGTMPWKTVMQWGMALPTSCPLAVSPFRLHMPLYRCLPSPQCIGMPKVLQMEDIRLLGPQLPRSWSMGDMGEDTALVTVIVVRTGGVGGVWRPPVVLIPPEGQVGG